MPTHPANPIVVMKTIAFHAPPMNDVTPVSSGIPTLEGSPVVEHSPYDAGINPNNNVHKI